MLFMRQLQTPLGPMRAIGGDCGLVLCEFDDRPMLTKQLARVERLFGETAESGDHPILDQTAAELHEYFHATRETFTIPLALEGTPFQTAIWNELLNIPFGRTTSYDALAERVGRPGSARAVGRANGDNRLAIIVPCHRVINGDGSLSGYGGGRHRKRWLITHEARGLQLPLLPEFGAISG